MAKALKRKEAFIDIFLIKIKQIRRKGR